MLPKYTQLLMTGDSITDCGRARPIGAKNTGMGSGYPAIVDGMLSALYPEKKIFCYNTAVSGSTTAALREKYDEFFIPEKHPTVVTLLIGINNVWRHFDVGSYFPESLKRLDIVHYEEDLRFMIEKVTASGCKLVLMTPYFLDPNSSHPMRKMCDDYAQTVRRLANEYRLPLCDTQKVFDEFLTKADSCLVSADRVHPNTTGHYVIANALLKTLTEMEL